jgi:hypothetical protein
MSQCDAQFLGESAAPDVRGGRAKCKIVWNRNASNVLRNVTSGMPGFPFIQVQLGRRPAPAGARKFPSMKTFEDDYLQR